MGPALKAITTTLLLSASRVTWAFTSTSIGNKGLRSLSSPSQCEKHPMVWDVRERAVVLPTSTSLPASFKVFGRSVIGRQPEAAIPTLDNWVISRIGRVTGKILNHPNPQIFDGEIITTSKVSNPDAAEEGSIVITESGSQYKLGRTAMARRKKKKIPVRPAESNSYDSMKDKPTSIYNRGGGFFGGSFGKNPSAPEETTAYSYRNGETEPSLMAQLSEQKMFFKPPSQKNKEADLKRRYGLSGKTIGNGKYLLCGNPKRSTSGKSQIFAGYLAGEDGLPASEKLAIKVSSNKAAIKREDMNYQRVTSGLFPGRFVNKIEFLREAGSERGFENQCALVIESGIKDLKAVIADRGGRGLKGRAMRDAAASSAQCIQAVHSSNMVWTDLKSENFVVTSDDPGGEEDFPEVKGIDLESAMPYRDNPVDFSPEACPPEFAQAFITGQAESFILDYSYDIWSYGMMLYELSTGKPYFYARSPSQITKMLKDPDFEADVSRVPDPKLRDLIYQCLQQDPKKRPKITRILLHPYFITSGFGPFSF